MGRLSAALIVDADPKGLETLTYGFEGDGCRVASTAAYASVPPLLSSKPTPAVAVVVLREPSAPGIALIRGLRDAEATRNLPLLVLGPAALEAEARAAAPGINFLPLPVFVRDVLTASKMLTAVHQVNPAGGPEADIEGSLSDYGLFYLVRTMIGLGRSGILQIERGSRRGELRFSDGEVTTAQVGSLQGSAALHHLLLWEDAALHLKLRAVVHRGTFNKRSADVIDEAERFLRDFAHATKDLGPTDRVLAADADKAMRAGDSIPIEVVPIVRLFDGQRTLSDVIDDSPFRVFDTLRIVSRLMDLGILAPPEKPAELVARVPNGTAARRPSALDEWLKPREAAPVVQAAAGQEGGGPTPAVTITAAPAREQRSGPTNRRRSKRERNTADMTAPRFRPSPGKPPGPGTPPQGSGTSAPASAGAGLVTPPGSAAATATGTTGSTGPAEAATSPTAPPSAGERRSSGIIEVKRGELRGGGRPAPTATDGASVVVDLSPGEAAPNGTTSGLTAPTPPPSFSPPPATVLPGSVPLSMHKPKTHAVGVMEARKSNGTGVPVPAPSPPSGGSIQLDPALMAEMEAINLANVPPTPPPVSTGAPPAASASPSQPQQQAAAPAAVVSFVRAGDNGRAATLARPPAAAGPAARSRVGGAVPGRPLDAGSLPGPATPPPKATVSGPPGDPRHAGRRPSSEFSALESDFFEREADLFKEEEAPAESFDDLDRRRR